MTTTSQFNCAICGQGFEQKSRLARHMDTSHPPSAPSAANLENARYGNLTCSISTDTNGLGQDTSNPDNIAVGDDYDFSFAGQGNGTLSLI